VCKVRPASYRIKRPATNPLGTFHSRGPWRYTQRQENLIGAEASRRAPLLPLGELVRLYLQHTGQFGQAVALVAFGLSPSETERLFSGYDEDYHISRFLQFTEEEGQKFSINGVSSTHVAIDAGIQTIL